VDNLSGFIKEGKKEPLKFRLMKIKGLGIPPIDYTPSGMPSADTPAIKILSGNPDKGQYGKAYDYFRERGEEEEGKRCCEALNNWLKFKQIETLLVTYIVPL
jgi:DNA polymerase-1